MSSGAVSMKRQEEILPRMLQDDSTGLYLPALQHYDMSSLNRSLSATPSPVEHHHHQHHQHHHQQLSTSHGHGRSLSFPAADDVTQSGSNSPYSPYHRSVSPPPLTPARYSTCSHLQTEDFAQSFAGWSFTPATRAQRRFIQPEVYARRRFYANQRERGRMTEMNCAFDKLRKKIPMYPAEGRKMSKIDTLRLAKQYIMDLKTLLAMDDVHEGYDFKLSPAETRARRDADSSESDYTSSSPSSSGDADVSGSSLSSSQSSDALSRKLR